MVISQECYTLRFTLQECYKTRFIRHECYKTVFVMKRKSVTLTDVINCQSHYLCVLQGKLIVTLQLTLTTKIVTLHSECLCSPITRGVTLTFTALFRQECYKTGFIMEALSVTFLLSERSFVTFLRFLKPDSVTFLLFEMRFVTFMMSLIVKIKPDNLSGFIYVFYAVIIRNPRFLLSLSRFLYLLFVSLSFQVYLLI